MATADGFCFGRSLKGADNCCTKPVGCTMTHEGCLFLKHPWKRAILFGDTTVRCQASSPITGQCTLLNGHDGQHQSAVSHVPDVHRVRAT